MTRGVANSAEDSQVRGPLGTRHATGCALTSPRVDHRGLIPLSVSTLDNTAPGATPGTCLRQLAGAATRGREKRRERPAAAEEDGTWWLPALSAATASPRPVAATNPLPQPRPPTATAGGRCHHPAAPAAASRPPQLPAAVGEAGGRHHHPNIAGTVPPATAIAADSQSWQPPPPPSSPLSPPATPTAGEAAGKGGDHLHPPALATVSPAHRFQQRQEKQRATSSPPSKSQPAPASTGGFQHRPIPASASDHQSLLPR